jgi:predicted aconitase
MGVPKDFAKGQMRIIKAFKQMNIEPSCTCTPYLIDHVPQRDTQVAWAESNAVCFCNSVLGARTNRESGPMALASGITGLTPFYGYRKKENRKPGAIVEIEATLKDPVDYSALGYVTGEVLGETTPYFRGLGNPNIESLKTLGASCATSGSIGLWHGEGVTPEAVWSSKYLKDLETVTIEDLSLKEAYEKLSLQPENPTYCIGCPHCNLREIKEITEQLKGERLNNSFWVFTSRGIYKKAVQAGYVGKIRDAGGRIYRDTCMVVAPLDKMGWKGVVTNSFKGGHYSMANGLPTKITSLKEVVKEALK